MHFEVQALLFFLRAYAQCGAQCRQYRRCNRCDKLDHEFCSFLEAFVGDRLGALNLVGGGVEDVELIVEALHGDFAISV